MGESDTTTENRVNDNLPITLQGTLSGTSNDTIPSDVGAGNYIFRDDIYELFLY